MATVLGLPGDLITDDSCLSVTEWRVSGKSGLRSELPTGDLLCRICSAKLVQVVQVNDLARLSAVTILKIELIGDGC